MRLKLILLVVAVSLFALLVYAADEALPASRRVLTADQLFLMGELEDVEEWIRVDSEEGNFTVEMPGAPEFTHELREYRIGDVDENIYYLETDGADFTVEYSDLPTIAVLFGRNILYRMVRRNFLRECDGQEISFEKYKLGRRKGKQLDYIVPATKEEPARRGKALFLLIKKRLYVVVATASEGSDKAGWVKRFMGSFEITPRIPRERGHKYKELTQEGGDGQGDVSEGGSKMTIRIVYDNNESEGGGLVSDWGFGCVLDAGGKRILFDAGEDGAILLGNMRRLGIEPDSIDIVVISHAHTDHIGGLKVFLGERGGTIPVYLPASLPDEFKRRIEASGAGVVEVKGPQGISEGIWTTGEMGDDVREQALAAMTSNGIAVVTGCAHPGIVQVVERAAEVAGAKPYAAIGGFHLSGAPDSKIEGVASSLKRMGVVRVAPCHCTGGTARRIFEREFGEGYVSARVGTVIEF